MRKILLVATIGIAGVLGAKEVTFKNENKQEIVKDRNVYTSNVNFTKGLCVIHIYKTDSNGVRRLVFSYTTHTSTQEACNDLRDGFLEKAADLGW